MSAVLNPTERKNFRSVANVIVSIFLCTLAYPLWAAQDQEFEWKLAKQKNQISVYTRSVSGSRFKAILGTMEVSATPGQVAALLRDVQNCVDWVAMCKEARVVRRISDRQEIVYGRNDLPFPALDRDGFSLNQWTIDCLLYTSPSPRDS